ncbi:FAD-binding protein [Cryptosporangium minutisporangium]|uniref:FAD-binding protein n=1 Tax=Cryptosporangium minutisporangium TaxID=113569 RepID=UPI0035EEF59C
MSAWRCPCERGAAVNLSRASVVLCAGSGLLGADPRAVCTRLTDVAHALGGEVGATRAVVDAGWLGRDRLIGATGVPIAPVLYVGFGVSGAVWHERGRPVHVVSVNTDPAAPLAAAADLMLRTDAAALVDELALRLPGRHPDVERRIAAADPDPGHRPAGGAVPGVNLVVPVGTPHERLRMLTGVPSGPVRPVPPLAAAPAADVLVAFLIERGYLGGSRA